jgi:hypothetical protein
MSGCVLIHVLKRDVSARCMRSETVNKRHERVILSSPGCQKKPERSARPYVRGFDPI